MNTNDEVIKTLQEIRDILSDRLPRKKSVVSKKEITPKMQRVAKIVRDTYKKSYFDRHGKDPTFAAKENKLVYDLMRRVGEEESIMLARRYPFYNDPCHVRATHPFGMLVKYVDQIRIQLDRPEQMFEAEDIRKQIREGKESYLRKQRVEEYVRKQTGGKGKAIDGKA